MDADSIKMLLGALGTTSVTGENWVRGRCPLSPWTHASGTDKNPSFGIEVIDGGESWFNCYSCGNHGDLLTLVHEAHRLNKMNPVVDYDWKTAREIASAELEVVGVHVLDYDMVKKKPKPQTINIFDPQWLASFPLAQHYYAPTQYLIEERGLKTAEFDDYDLRWDATQGRVGFPVYLPGGVCVGMHGRDVNPETDMPYYAYGFHGKRNPHVWYGENWLDLKSPVVLTEGTFDVVKIRRVYDNTLASFTASLSLPKRKRVRDFIGIVTYYDHGAGGDSARATLTEEAAAYNIPISHIIPTAEEGDAGDTDTIQIYEYLKDAFNVVL